MGEYKLLLCQETANQDLFTAEAKVVYRLCENLRTNERVDALLADADFFGPTVRRSFPDEGSRNLFSSAGRAALPGYGC